MTTMQTPDENQQTSQQAAIETETETATAPPAGDVRGRTWAHGVPAMRVQRMRWRLSGRPALASETPADETAAAGAGHAPPGFPRSIWLVRAATGVILLGLAWVGALAIYLLAVALFAPLSRQRLVTTLPLRFAEGLGACLLVAVVATLLIVGAFALSLAVHPNDPPARQPAAASRAEGTDGTDE